MSTSSAPNPAPVPGPSSTTTSLQTSIDATERLLKECTSRTRRGNLLTMIVGAIILVMLSGYFAYGYSEIASVTEPKTLVSAAETWLEDQIPEVRKQLENEVDKSAPIWAESLSKQAQSSLPTLREKLEAYVVEQVDQTMEHTVNLTEEHFRKMLKEKRGVLEDGFKDLATSPQLAAESLKELEQILEGAFQADMKQGADDLFATLKLMSEKLERLKANKEMTSEETLERLVLMQFRKLQSEQIFASSAAQDAKQAEKAEKADIISTP